MSAPRKASTTILVRTDSGVVFNKTSIDRASLRYVRLPSGEIRPMRAAIYVSAEEEARSLPPGWNAHRYAARIGAQVSHFFADDATSSSNPGYYFQPVGDNDLARSGFRNLLAAASDGRFERLVIDEGGAPWASNRPITTEAFCVLHECGVVVHTVGRGKWSLEHAASAALNDEAFGLRARFESRQAHRRYA